MCVGIVEMYEIVDGEPVDASNRKRKRARSVKKS